MPRQPRLLAADAAGAAGSATPGRQGTRNGRRTLLLAAWALLLAAVFAVALRSSAEDGSTRAAGEARVAGRSAVVPR